MYYWLVRWRARKLACRGDQHVTQTRLLLDARGVEMQPCDQSLIQERLQQ